MQGAALIKSEAESDVQSYSLGQSVWQAEIWD